MKLHKYDYMFIVAMILWFLETWYFGFNEKAGSIAEKMCNSFALILGFYGFINSIAVSFTKPIHIKFQGENSIKKIMSTDEEV